MENKDFLTLDQLTATEGTKDYETISAVNWDFQNKWKPYHGNHKCPKCGGSDIEYNTQLVLTSNPPQNQLRCKKCNYIFSSGFNMEQPNKTNFDKPWEIDHSILNTPKIGDWFPYEEAPSYPDIYLPNKSSMIGWICPKCGRCLAPHLDSCKFCKSDFISNTIDSKLNTLNTTNSSIDDLPKSDYTNNTLNNEMVQKFLDESESVFEAVDKYNEWRKINNAN